MKKKTRLEWFEEFPSPWREQAIENTNPKYMHLKHKSARHSLNTAFSWCIPAKGQGKKYWRAFCDTLPVG